MNKDKMKFTDLYRPYPEVLLKAYATMDDEVQRHFDNTDRSDWDIRNCFEVRDIINPSSEPKVISISLFAKTTTTSDKSEIQHINGQIPMEYLSKKNPPMLEHRTHKKNKHGESWIDIFLNPIIRSVGSHMDGWGRRIYLAKDLECLIPILIENGFEIRLMKHESVRHNPGALWRFLPTSDSKLDRVLFCDSDGDNSEKSLAWKHFMKMEKILDENKGIAQMREPRSGSPSGVLYPIGAGMTMCAPGRIDFDVKQSLKGYTNFCILHDNTIRSLATEVSLSHFSDDKLIENPSQNSQALKVSGTHFPIYSFDEGYLRNFTFFHLTDRKQLGTIAGQGTIDAFGKDGRQGHTDLEYCSETGNPIFKFDTLELMKYKYEQ